MKEEPISRPEFNLYVKMNAESAERMSKAIDRMATDNKELHDQLIEYMHSHDTLETRVSNMERLYEKLSKAVIANSKVTSIANKVGWGISIFLAGGLGAFGKDLAQWALK